MTLRNLTALITGASRGLGRAMARRFADEGANLFLCARTAEALMEVECELRAGGGQVGSQAADVSNGGEVERLVTMALKRFGRIDVLVNNASILGPRVELLEYPRQVWQQVLGVNLTGTFIVTQSVAKHMVQREQGSIINVTSGVGTEGRPRWGAYSVSKFGVEGMTQIWARELSPHRVRVNIVNPGSVATQMRREAYPREDPSTLPKPEDVLDVFVYLASNESKSITGQRFDAQEFHWPNR